MQTRASPVMWLMLTWRNAKMLPHMGDHGLDADEYRDVLTDVEAKLESRMR